MVLRDFRSNVSHYLLKTTIQLRCSEKGTAKFLPALLLYKEHSLADRNLDVTAEIATKDGGGPDRQRAGPSYLCASAKRTADHSSRSFRFGNAVGRPLLHGSRSDQPFGFRRAFHSTTGA